MALIKCPECSKEVSSQAVSCPHCGFLLATATKESAQVEQPQPKAEGCGCGGCLSVILLFIGVGCIIQGVYGYKKWEQKESTLITEGYFHPAIGKKPELAIQKNYASAPADSADRWWQAIFGISCVGLGLWFLRKKYVGMKRHETGMAPSKTTDT